MTKLLFVTGAALLCTAMGGLFAVCIPLCRYGEFTLFYEDNVAIRLTEATLCAAAAVVGAVAVIVAGLKMVKRDDEH